MEVESGAPTATTPSSKTPRHDLMKDETKSHNTFFKQAKSYPMFPCKEEKVKWDDYGEPIRYGVWDVVLWWGVKVGFPLPLFPPHPLLLRVEDYAVKELVPLEEKEVILW